MYMNLNYYIKRMIHFEIQLIIIWIYLFFIFKIIYGAKKVHLGRKSNPAYLWSAKVRGPHYANLALQSLRLLEGVIYNGVYRYSWFFGGPGVGESNLPL